MTLYGPFVQAASDGRMGWLTDEFRPIPDQIRRTLDWLDARTDYTYSIWRGADPTAIDGYLKPANDSFIQAAGSADAMTVEVGFPGSDGEHHLYTVGRPEVVDGTTTLIPMSDDRAVRVFTNEIFTADEAAAIFHMFYLSEVVSAPYVLRELDLAQELSELR
ncbi:hypothetical protein AB0N61_00955 [Microbacterium sp. NPDC089320]|uniref:hypothetical protein n=1 Tax=Microbacterium sp. NPDC089320 TaxID=3155182 RepID=UPI0034464FF5